MLLQWSDGSGSVTETTVKYLTSKTIDHSDMTIEATRSSTTGVWSRNGSAYSLFRAELLTMMSMFLPTSWLFIRVRLEGLCETVENERNSSGESSKLGQVLM